jgi:hypothetical protein
MVETRYKLINQLLNNKLNGHDDISNYIIDLVYINETKDNFKLVTDQLNYLKNEYEYLIVYSPRWPYSETTFTHYILNKNNNKYKEDFYIRWK